MPELNPDIVRHALQVARKRGFAEVEVETEGGRFSASLEKVKTKPRSSSDTQVEPSEHLAEISSTHVGYYGESKAPLEVGRTIERGEVVAVISALGLANEIEADYSGEVVEVLVSVGDPVEYGQPIARVKVG